MFTKSCIVLAIAIVAIFGSTATGSFTTAPQQHEQEEYEQEAARALRPRRGRGKKNRGRNGGGNRPRPDFMNITCTDEDIDFSCDLPRGGDEDLVGVFVCRERRRGNRGPIPICIPTNKSIEGDECGCCDEECPVPCTACPCDLTDSDKEGVEVLVPDSEEPICVPKFASARMIYKSDGMVTCNEDCP